MSTVTRLFSGPMRGSGDFILHANAGPQFVNRDSGVWGTITELEQPVGEPLDFPFIGAANMAVDNIAPRDDGIIDMWIHIDHDGALNYKIQVLVSND